MLVLFKDISQKKSIFLSQYINMNNVAMSMVLSFNIILYIIESESLVQLFKHEREQRRTVTAKQITNICLWCRFYEMNMNQTQQEMCRSRRDKRVSGGAVGELSLIIHSNTMVLGGSDYTSLKTSIQQKTGGNGGLHCVSGEKRANTERLNSLRVVWFGWIHTTTRRYWNGRHG